MDFATFQWILIWVLFNHPSIYAFRVWMIHGVKLEQSYDLQQFEGECEQAESLMAEMEASLRRKVDGGM